MRWPDPDYKHINTPVFIEAGINGEMYQLSVGGVVDISEELAQSLRDSGYQATPVSPEE